MYLQHPFMEIEIEQRLRDGRQNGTVSQMAVEDDAQTESSAIHMNYKDKCNLVKRGSEQGSSQGNDVMTTSWLRRGQCTRTTEHTRICTTPLYVAIPTYILSENYSVQVLILHHPSSNRIGTLLNHKRSENTERTFQKTLFSDSKRQLTS